MNSCPKALPLWANETKPADLFPELGRNAHGETVDSLHGVLPLVKGAVAGRWVQAELHSCVDLCNKRRNPPLTRSPRNPPLTRSPPTHVLDANLNPASSL